MTGGKELVNGTDLNPACALYEILTDTEWGYGQPSSDVDLTNFRAAGATLYDENNGWSFLWDAERDLADIVREIERQIDGVLLWNRNTGLWQIKLIRADYSLMSLPAVDESVLVRDGVREWSKSSWDDTFNQAFVHFSSVNPNTGDWQEATVNEQDQIGRAHV